VFDNAQLNFGDGERGVTNVTGESRKRLDIRQCRTWLIPGRIGRYSWNQDGAPCGSVSYTVLGRAVVLELLTIFPKFAGLEMWVRRKDALSVDSPVLSFNRSVSDLYPRGIPRINLATWAGSSICTKCRAPGTRNSSDAGKISWKR
jgi:hypothetical protein